ncbi:unnamed protein product [Microthlaspi erraticum]|uniref:Endonuclease/exonuclease/phosphatase domain-containing protein n=1 Tax=Microthlaspi erraticum TaxID=1685480 RepID=A0A6D2K6C0_9BRAS|nr:unnamed protein product [Microthlaspi erraticum]
MDSSKKLGGPPRNKSSFWDFHTMAINCKLHELRSSGNRFSWAGWRDKVRVQWRLDRSFGNDGWYQLFPCSQLEYMDMWASDHRPLKVCFAMETELLNRGSKSPCASPGSVLTSLDPGDSIVISKAFSHMLNLANLAEEVQIAYRRRIKKLKKGDFVNESSASTESDIEERDFEYKRLVSDLRKSPERDL